MLATPLTHVPFVNLIDQSGAQSRADSDHNPWKGVAKGFLPNDIRPRNRVAVRLYKINDNHAVDRPEHAGRDLHHP